jgi:hypothetical protein
MVTRLRDAGYIVPRMRPLTLADLLRECERYGYDPEVTFVRVDGEDVFAGADNWDLHRNADGSATFQVYGEECDDWPEME